MIYMNTYLYVVFNTFYLQFLHCLQHSYLNISLIYINKVLFYIRILFTRFISFKRTSAIKKLLSNFHLKLALICTLYYGRDANTM